MVVTELLLSVSRFVRVCRHGILVEEGSLLVSWLCCYVVFVFLRFLAEFWDAWGVSRCFKCRGLVVGDGKCGV